MEELAKQLANLGMKDLQTLTEILYEVYKLNFELNVDTYLVREKVRNSK